MHLHTESDVKVRRYAIELEDTALLAKLEPENMIALEAKYVSSKMPCKSPQ